MFLAAASRGLALLALVGITFGCGDSDSNETAGETTTTEQVGTTATTPEVLDSEQLDAAILEVDLLPPGWVEDPMVLMASVHGGRLCPAGRDELMAETHEGRTAAFARNLDNGPWVEQAISTAPDMEEHFADHKNVATSCVGQTWTENVEGEDVTFSMLDASPSELGDDQAAFRVNMSYPDGYTSVVEYVMVRSGSVLQEYWGIDDEFSPFQPGEFGEIVDRGSSLVDKVASIG